MGRNYREHARELGSALPTEPLIFLKPPSTRIANGEPIALPPGVGRVDFEGEIGFVVGRRARHLTPETALTALSHVVPINDVTARGLQRHDDQWTRAKGFDTFCPVGEPVPFDPPSILSLTVETRVNGELRQAGALTDFIFPLGELVSWISRIMTLEPGDLIATGTPAGVGPLEAGDRVRVEIPGVGSVENPVEAGIGLSWGAEGAEGAE